MDGNREALGTRLRGFGRAVENGGTFHTFCEQQLTELLPKNSKNSEKATSQMLSAIEEIC